MYINLISRNNTCFSTHNQVSITHFGNVSEDFIRGALTVLINSPSKIEYQTNVNTSQWNLKHNTQIWDDLLFYGDNSTWQHYNDIQSTNPDRYRWERYIRSRYDSVRRYIAEIDYGGQYNIIHFSNIDYLSGVISANMWVRINYMCIINVWDNFEKCKMRYRYSGDIITTNRKKYQRDVIKCVDQFLLIDICNIIYEYAVNICNWNQSCNPCCLTECGNQDRCEYHLLNNFNDWNSFYKCDVELTSI